MLASQADAVAAATDEELVARIAECDEVAFREIYERYFPRIYRFVDRRLPNRADTEETVQEVFFNIFSSVHTYRGDAPFVAWVFGLTRRTLANRFKKRSHPTVPLAEDEAAAIDVPNGLVHREADPHQAYEFAERLRRMQAAATGQLSQEQWSLFRLHHLENRSIHEIARTRHTTEDAVKSHLYRARKLLLAR